MQNIRTSVNAALSAMGIGTKYETIATKNVGGASKAYKIRLKGGNDGETTIYLIYENNKAYYFAHVHNDDTDKFFAGADQMLPVISNPAIEPWGTSAGGQHRRGYKIKDGLDAAAQTAVMTNLIQGMISIFEFGI